MHPEYLDTIAFTIIIFFASDNQTLSDADYTVTLRFCEWSAENVT